IGDMRERERGPTSARTPSIPPPITTRAAPTDTGESPAGPSACAVPVVPKRRAATRTYSRAISQLLHNYTIYGRRDRRHAARRPGPGSGIVAGVGARERAA